MNVAHLLTPHVDLGYTVGRYSHLSLRGCVALQKYFVAHGRVNQLFKRVVINGRKMLIM
jgi:hypothetical protein